MDSDESRITIHRFNPLPGLTRMETLERVMIANALRRFTHDHGLRIQNRKKAALWLGINRGTLNRRLKFYTAAGCPIKGSEVGPASRKEYGPRRKRGEGVKLLLAELGVDMSKHKERPFWKLSQLLQEDYLRTANKYRMEKMRKHHPDNGGDSKEFVRVNALWRQIRRIFKHHGIFPAIDTTENKILGGS